MVRPLAARVARLDWHVQVNAPATYLLEQRATWADLPCPVVFDHLARVPHPDGVNHPVFAMVVDLLSTAVPDEAVRNRILVDNPAVLYQFG